MKRRYIYGISAILIFLIVAFISFDKSKIEYADFNKAKEQSKTVQVMGSWVKEKDYYYDSRNNQFIFYMKDANDEIVKIIHSGSKPNNFEIADNLVVKGKFQSDEFHSTDILTKCPSKYEGQAEDLMKY